MNQKLISAAQWLQRRAENVAVALLSVMFATFIIQIFARYVLNKPIGWSEEVIITTWLWTVLWGAAFILRESDEIRFDIVYSQVSERTRRIFTVLSGVALVGPLFRIAARRLQLRQLHEGRTLRLSARADQLAVLRLHHFQRCLYLPVLLAGVSGRARRQVA